MKHLIEVLKIVDGAVNGDRKKVLAYAEQLAQKLEVEEGGTSPAQRIRKYLNNSRLERLYPASSPASLPVDHESRASLADERLLTLDEAQGFFEPHIEDRAQEFIQYVNASDQLAKAGLQFIPRILLYGPPGCGKSLLASCIAAQLSLPLITVRIDGLVSSYLGSTSKNIRNIFEYASRQPCILFLDELDAIAKLRDDHHELGELKRVVVTLLQNLDALDSSTIVLAATNHEHLLDSAIWRRFSYKLQLEKPSSSVRYRILEKELSGYSDTSVLRKLTSATSNMSGAEIVHVTDEAKRKAVLSGNKRISAGDALKAILETKEPKILYGSAPLVERIQQARELAPTVFTYRILADIFSVSTGYLSRLLSEGGDDGNESVEKTLKASNDQ